MKLIQMQYSPDAFDSFIKGKLEEVEVDPALADKYWEQFSLEKPNLKPKAKKFNYKHLSIIGGISLFIISVLFYYSSQNNAFTSDKDVPVTSTQIKPAEVNENGLDNHDAESKNKLINQSENIQISKIPNTEGSTKRTLVKEIHSKKLDESVESEPTKKQLNNLTITQEENENMIKEDNKSSQGEQVKNKEIILPDSSAMRKNDFADKASKKKKPGKHIIW